MSSSVWSGVWPNGTRVPFASSPEVVPSAPGKRPKYSSKERFSLSMMTICVIACDGGGPVGLGLGLGEGRTVGWGFRREECWADTEWARVCRGLGVPWRGSAAVALTAVPVRFRLWRLFGCVRLVGFAATDRVGVAVCRRRTRGRGDGVGADGTSVGEVTGGREARVETGAGEYDRAQPAITRPAPMIRQQPAAAGASAVLALAARFVDYLLPSPERALCVPIPQQRQADRGRRPAQF